VAMSGSTTRRWCGTEIRESSTRLCAPPRMMTLPSVFAAATTGAIITGSSAPRRLPHDATAWASFGSCSAGTSCARPRPRPHPHPLQRIQLAARRRMMWWSTVVSWCPMPCQRPHLALRLPQGPRWGWSLTCRLLQHQHRLQRPRPRQRFKVVTCRQIFCWCQQSNQHPGLH